jgi:predicted RNA methylase
MSLRSLKRRLGDIRRLPLRYRELSGDRRLGIDTVLQHRLMHIDMRAERCVYDAVTYAGLRQIDRLAPVARDDVVYDLGCGKGRIVCHYTAKTVSRVIGVEYDPDLANDARANLARMNGRLSPAEIVTGDAADQDLSRATYVFMFNPFGVNTLRRVLAQLATGEGALRIIYANPVHVAVFRDFPTLRAEKRFHMPYDVQAAPVQTFVREPA